MSDRPPASAGDDLVKELLSIAAASVGDATVVVPTLLAAISQRLGFEVATMWRWRPDEGLLRCEYTWRDPRSTLEGFLQATRGLELHPGAPVPGAVLQTGEPIWISDVGAYPDFQRGPIAVAAGLRSGAAIPVRAHGDVVGVFELFSLHPREPDEGLFEAVAAASARLGEFIERLELEAQNSALLVELESSRRRQEFLLDATRALSTTRGLTETIEGLAAIAVPALGDLCLIDVLGEHGHIERMAARHALPSYQALANELRQYPPDFLGVHPAADVIRTGESHAANTMTDEFLRSTTRSLRHYQLTKDLGFTSYLSAPLLSGEQLLGAVTMVSAGSGRRFGPDDLSLLHELAAQVAFVIEREQRYERQRDLALVLQRSMLPEKVESIPGYSVVARYLASDEISEVGGDFYDVVRISAEQVALVVGDVEGHDLVAATAMAKVRSAVRAYLEVTSDPAAVLELLDRFVQDHVGGRAVTLVLGLLDLRTGAIRLASAGHPPPLLIDGGVVPAPLVTGLPAGIGLGTYVAREFILPPGGGIAFYTDGLVEDRVEGPDARVEELIRQLELADRADFNAACDAVLSSTLGSAVVEDDICFLWVMRAGNETDWSTGATTRRFPRLPTSVAAARRFVLASLSDLDVAQQDDIAHMVSELVTNAFLHAHSDALVEVERSSDEVRVAVRDFGPGTPSLQDDPSSTDDHGRGLLILKALAQAWGVSTPQEGPGKVVWFSAALR